MIESGVSNAALVARIIPRVNAWAITGTPVGGKIDDLYGLLIFLRVEPWVSQKKLWHRLTENKEWFRALFNRLSLRHTKDIVRDEIRLPPQKRIIISLGFTQVEEENYQRLFGEACFKCGVHTDG